MSRHMVEKVSLRGGRARSVAVVAAVGALAVAGGYTGALWAGGDELDAVQINTGHLNVRILKGVGERGPLTDGDGDGVSWFVGSTPAQPDGDVVWTLVDVETPLVYPGETWVAAIPFTVGLEGHNLLADLTLEGVPALDGLGIGEAGFAVADGVVTPGEGTPSDDLDPVGLDESFQVALPAKTQADDAAKFTVLVTFEVPGSGDQTETAADLRGLETAIANLSITVQQDRSVEGGE